MATKYDYSKEYRDTFRYLECVTNPSAHGIVLTKSLSLHELYRRGFLTGQALADAKKES